MFSPLVRPVRPLFTISEMPLVNRTRDGLCWSWGGRVRPPRHCGDVVPPSQAGPGPLKRDREELGAEGPRPPGPGSGATSPHTSPRRSWWRGASSPRVGGVGSAPSPHATFFTVC